jgi:hypothetical protein
VAFGTGVAKRDVHGLRVHLPLALDVPLTPLNDMAVVRHGLTLNGGKLFEDKEKGVIALAAVAL